MPVIDWTVHTGTKVGCTGTPEYRVEADGLVRWRGIMTLTAAAPFTNYIIFPPEAVPAAGVNTFFFDYDSGQRGILANATEFYMGVAGGLVVGSTVNLQDFVYQGNPPAVAAGGLIVRDGQYEFNGILMNDNVGETDTLRVITCAGLFDLPDMKVTDSELQDDHGGQVGRDLLTMRRIILDLKLIGSTKANIYNKVRAVAAAFQPQNTLIPFVFQRAGIGKMFLPVRPRRLSGFDTGAKLDHGLGEGSVMLLAPDPRKLAYELSSQAIVIAVSGTTNSGTVTMNGNFKGGAKPILEIAGPVTNPRITNAHDEGRAIRIDMVIGSGQTLIVNAHDRTVTLAGVDQSANVRTDNQWWNLMPGGNLITFTRSNSPANTGTLTVKWWDSFV